MSRPFWLLGLAALLAPQLALAQSEGTACIETHEQALKDKQDGRLLSAGASLRTCSKAPCPGMIREECSRLARELERETPSILLVVRDASGRELEVRDVEIDGTPVALSETRPTRLDPGKRRLRVRLFDGNTRELGFVIERGEAKKTLRVVFPTEALKPRPAEPVSPEKKPAAQSATTPWMWVALGVGTAALGSFVYFAQDGRSREREMRDSCAPRCPQSQADRMHRSYLLADISLLASAGALGTAGYLFFSAGPTTATDQDRGAMLRVGSRF